MNSAAEGQVEPPGLQEDVYTINVNSQVGSQEFPQTFEVTPEEPREALSYVSYIEPPINESIPPQAGLEDFEQGEEIPKEDFPNYEFLQRKLFRENSYIYATPAHSMSPTVSDSEDDREPPKPSLLIKVPKKKSNALVYQIAFPAIILALSIIAGKKLRLPTLSTDIVTVIWFFKRSWRGVPLYGWFTLLIWLSISFILIRSCVVLVFKFLKAGLLASKNRISLSAYYYIAKLGLTITFFLWSILHYFSWTSTLLEYSEDLPLIEQMVSTIFLFFIFVSLFRSFKLIFDRVLIGMFSSPLTFQLITNVINFGKPFAMQY